VCVINHTGRGSVEWWVTWVMGHKIWPVVSSEARYIGTTEHSKNIIASAAHSLQRHKSRPVSYVPNWQCQRCSPEIPHIIANMRNIIFTSIFLILSYTEPTIAISIMFRVWRLSVKYRGCAFDDPEFWTPSIIGLTAEKHRWHHVTSHVSTYCIMLTVPIDT